jgi:thioredoxin 1
MELILTDSNFDAEVIKSTQPVLVDFWAEWCGPCKMLGPTIDAIAKEYAGKVKVGKVNVDDNPGVSSRFGIRSIPTLIIFKNGNIIEQVIGLQSKESIKSKLDLAIA